MAKGVERRITDLLKKKGEDLLKAPPEPVQFADDPDADKLISDLENYPHAYVIACIMDRQIKAERAWGIPYKLSQRLRTFEFDDLYKMKQAKIQKAMTKPVALHRYVDDMSLNIRLALDRIHDQYEGDASRIWKGKPSSAEVTYRFLQFRGVGPKIATMAVNLLARFFKIKFSDHYSIDISVDVQVKRAMIRLGLVPKDASLEQIIYRARSLNPDYPGVIDSPLWNIGRDWCRPKKPVCKECYMRKVCPSAKMVSEGRQN